METEGNPFTSVKKVLTFDELIDIAFNKAMKIKPPVGRFDGLTRTKTFEINRINTAANVLVNNLENIVHNFPSLNLIHPFYLDLANILLDTDELRRSLGRVNGVVQNIRDLEEEIKEKILSSNSKESAKQQRKILFARFSSMIRRIKSSLITIKEASEKLSLLPGFNPLMPTVVLCGFPNTGKSSFIKLTSSGKPEIANYPFTTKKIIFGHRKFGFITIQFVDTPGLLDRPLHERNVIELQALAVFKHLSDFLIFLFDVSPNASADIDDQMNLYKEINKFYPASYFMPTISKSDLLVHDTLVNTKRYLVSKGIVNSIDEIWDISTANLEGVAKLTGFLEDRIKLEVLKNPKYRHISTMNIADDQLTYEQLDEDQY